MGTSTRDWMRVARRGIGGFVVGDWTGSEHYLEKIGALMNLSQLHCYLLFPPQIAPKNPVALALPPRRCSPLLLPTDPAPHRWHRSPPSSSPAGPRPPRRSLASMLASCRRAPSALTRRCNIWLFIEHIVVLHG